MYKKGLIVKREEKNYFCEKCGRFLPDRYIEGTCPHCRSEEARGDQCENCGKWLETFELINPKCKICGSTPYLKDTFNYYFLLPKLKEKLEKWLNEKENWKDFVKNFALSWVKEGLKERSITRDLSWGVPVPLEEAKGKVLYVWFDAPIGYISITQEWAEKKGENWENWWKNKEVKLIHFLGKDNIVFHAVIWPAMLMGYEEYILPSEIPANQYLVMKEGKMSTSRGIALWVEEFLKNYPPDYIRFGVARVLPESKDSEFSIEDFERECDTYLANDIGNLVSRIFKLFEKYMSLRVPSKREKKEHENRMWEIINSKIQKVENNFENFKFRQALQETIEIAQEVNRYIDFTKPWDKFKNNKEDGERIIYNSLSAIKLLSVLLYPFLPFTMKTLRKTMNLKEPSWEEVGNPILKEGEILKSPPILFPRIREKVKQESTIQEKKQEKVEKKEDFIEYEEFKKVKLIVGKILNVEDIKGADKLYKLEVDTGDRIRTVIAGIKEYYKKEELKGKNIVVVSNLKPRKIKGILSEGMVLAAETKEGVFLLEVDSRASPGSEVL